MERSMVLCGLVALCALLSAAPIAVAQWVPNGVLVLSTAIDEGNFPGVRCALAPDGQGGVIVAWAQDREGTGGDIFVQRIDARGYLRWGTGGIAVCAAAGEQFSPVLATDGEGGAIILWSDSRDDLADVYAQHVGGAGNLLWTANGAPIRTGEREQTVAGAISNGPRGTIVVWQDRPNGAIDRTTLYAQQIDSDAGRLWPDSGVVVGPTGKSQEHRGMLSDGAGGALIAWKEVLEPVCSLIEIRMQRIDSRGERRWPDIPWDGITHDGVPVIRGRCYLESSLVSDGTGGAFLAWSDSQNGNFDVFAQHILSNGMPVWTEGGVPICTDPDLQYGPRIVRDASGGAIICFGKLFAGGMDADVYAQRVDRYGNTLWQTNGMPVCDAPGHQQIPAIVSDGSGGAIVAWSDFSAGDPGTSDVYAQHVTGEGVALWPSAGLSVSTAAGQQAHTPCFPDGEGGAIIAWQDSRSGKLAIYAQRIDRNGNWGYPAPAIEAVRDVPGDQGGFVNLSWLASRLDPWPGHAISSYSIWRGISPEQAAQAMKSGGAMLFDAKQPEAMLSNIADFGPQSEKPLVRVENTGSRTFFWKLISTVTASHLEGYSEIVRTLFDSTAVCGEYHYFQVIAHGDDPEMYWISTPDSGRSIDNLAPAAPAGLAGTPGSNAAGLNLTWNRCCEADLGHYAVYRGATEGFEPGPGNRMAALADTMYLDGEWRAGSRYHYKVAAVDIHGNASGCSLLRPEDIKGGEERETPAVTFLAQNFPNPFNPSTKIVFGLKEPEFVSLKVYDAAGRLVRVLVEADRAAGVHEALWNGRDDRGKQMSSGLYFCRLKAGSFTSLRKTVLLK